MTIEYLAPGIKCDLACTYCYQNSMRDAGNFGPKTDWEKVRAEIDKQGTDFTVFGGEVLLTPKEHLREVFEYGFKKFGKNGVQTNLLRLDDDHIKMFKDYNVHAGVSIDGYWPQNSPRSTKEQTERIVANLHKLAEAKVSFSLIITIHRRNALDDQLHYFIQDMLDLGVNSINYHDLEVEDESIQTDLGLSPEETLDAFIRLYRKFHHLAVHNAAPFSDIRRLLTVINAEANCTWKACDVLTTPAVHGIMPDGSLANCGRAIKDGVNWVKNTDEHKNERYIALYNTPQEYGGCKGCQYFYACKGQCPGTAIDGDWRNKTSMCEFWFGLIGYIHADLKAKGIACLTSEEMEDLGLKVSIGKPDHNDTVHQDTPHVDWHQDHNDMGQTKVYNLQDLINDAETKLQAR